jgi:hypothetical protein
MLTLFQSYNTDLGICVMVAIDDDDVIGLWYYDEETEDSYGPYSGGRNDIVACYRGMQIIDAALYNGAAFSEDILVSAWHLGKEGVQNEVHLEHLGNTVSKGKRRAVLQSPFPSIDQGLLYCVENDVDVDLEPIYNELKAKRLPYSALADNCVSAALLLVHGKLTKKYGDALIAIKGQRSSNAHNQTVNSFIGQSDAMVTNCLGIVEKSLSNIFKMFPRDEAPKEEWGGMIQTFTRRFKRSDLVEGAKQPSLYSIVGMERIAAGEAISALHNNLDRPHPFAEMKMPSYHANFIKLGKALHAMGKKTDDYMVEASDNLDTYRDIKLEINDLTYYVNMSVRDQLPDVYTLGLDG